MWMMQLKWLERTVAFSALDNKKIYLEELVAKQLLTNFLDELSNKKERVCLLFCSSGRTMFLLVDSCGSFYFVDSHSHANRGALIASVGPGQGKAFTDWIDRMMDINWQSPLTLGSVTEVIYA